jgi:hypothetical protein
LIVEALFEPRKSVCIGDKAEAEDEVVFNDARDVITSAPPIVAFFLLQNVKERNRDYRIRDTRYESVDVRAKELVG